MLFWRRHGAPVPGESGPVTTGLDAALSFERSLGSSVAVQDAVYRSLRDSGTEVRFTRASDAVAHALAQASTGLRSAAVVTGARLSAALPSVEHAVARRIPFVLYVVTNEPWDAVFHAGAAGAVVLAVADVRDVVPIVAAARRAAEDTLLPVLCILDEARIAQGSADLPVATAEALKALFPERIASPDAVQRLVFGEDRLSVPAWMDPDHPMGLGARMGGHDAVASAAGRRLLLDAEIPDFVDRAIASASAAVGRALTPVSVVGDEKAPTAFISAGPAPTPKVNGPATYRIVQCARLFPFPLEQVLARVARTPAALLMPVSPESTISRLASLLTAALGRPVPVGMAPVVYEPDLDPDLEDAARQLVRSTLADPFFPAAWRTMDRPGLPEPERLEQRLRTARPGFDRALVRGAESKELVPCTVFGGERLGPLVDQEWASAVAETSGGATRTWRVRTAGRGLAVSFSHGDGARHIPYGRSAAVAAECAADLDRLGLHDFVGRGTTVLVPDPENLSAEAVIRLKRAGARLFGVPLPDQVQGADVSHPLATALTVLAACGLPGAHVRAAAGASGGAKSRTASSTDPGPALAHDATRSLVGRLVRAGLVTDRMADALLRRIDESAPYEASFPIVEAPEPRPPSVLASLPGDTDRIDDPVRFWRTVGFAHASGRETELVPDPYRALGALPARAGWSPADSGTPPALPNFLPERCTGCSDCFAMCPQSAILVAAPSFDEALGAAFARLEASGRSAFQLSRLRKPVAQEAHRVFRGDLINQHPTLGSLVAEALERVMVRGGVEGEKRDELLAEFALLRAFLPEIGLARTDAWFQRPETTVKGSGRPFAWSVDPDRCSACGLCVAACGDGALEPVDATGGRLDHARAVAAFGRALPTPGSDVLEAVAGVYDAAGLVGDGANDIVSAGDDALHVTVRLAALAAERVVARARGTILDRSGRARTQLEEAARKAVSGAVAINDFEAFAKRLSALGDGLTPDALLSAAGRESSIDTARIQRLTEAGNRLRALETAWKSGDSGHGRARLMAVVDTELPVEWPVNPFAFPWMRVAPGTGAAAAAALAAAYEKRHEADINELRACEAAARDIVSEPVPFAAFDRNERSSAPVTLLVTDRLGEGVLRLLGERTDVRVLLLTTDPVGPSQVDPGNAVAALGSTFVAQVSFGKPRDIASAMLRAFEHDGVSFVHALVPPGPVVDAWRRAADAVTARAFPVFTFEPPTDERPGGRFDLSGNERPDDDFVNEAFDPLSWAGMGAETSRAWKVVRRGEAPAGLVSPREALLGAPGAQAAVPRMSDRVALVPEPVIASARKRLAAWRRLRAMAAAARSASLEPAPVPAPAVVADTPAPRPVVSADAHARLTARLLALSGFAPGDERAQDSLRHLVQAPHVPDPAPEAN